MAKRKPPTRLKIPDYEEHLKLRQRVEKYYREESKPRKVSGRRYKKQWTKVSQALLESNPLRRDRTRKGQIKRRMREAIQPKLREDRLSSEREAKKAKRAQKRAAAEEKKAEAQIAEEAKQKEEKAKEKQQRYETKLQRNKESVKPTLQGQGGV